MEARRSPSATSESRVEPEPATPSTPDGGPRVRPPPGWEGGFAGTRAGSVALPTPARGHAAGSGTVLGARLGAADLAPPLVAALVREGYDVAHIARDYDREGRISVPGAAEWSVGIEGMKAKAGEDLAAAFAPLTLRPKSGKEPEPGVITVFVPGLNTPEPEASRRTQIYVDNLDTPMANMANGSRESLGTFDPVGALPFKIDAGRRDWVSAGLAYLSLRQPPLSQRVADLLAANFAQASPQKMRLTFYSDSTISTVQGLKLFKEQEVERRMDKLMADGHRPRKKDVLASVEADLKRLVFIELHGNACYSLPEGPRYLVWTDKNDSLTFGKNPFSPHGKTGVSGQHPDPDYHDVVYIDYEGPYSDQGFNAHNLAANGIYTVAETLRRNGVTNGEELYELAKGGHILDVPAKDEVQGAPSELWS